MLEKNFQDKAEAVGATHQAHKMPQLPAPGTKYTPQNVLEVGKYYKYYTIVCEGKIEKIICECMLFAWRGYRTG